MSDETKIVFTEETINFVLEALGWYSDNVGCVREKSSDEYVLDVCGKPFKKTDIIAIHKNGVFTSITQALNFLSSV